MTPLAAPQAAPQAAFFFFIFMVSLRNKKGTLSPLPPPPPKMCIDTMRPRGWAGGGGSYFSIQMNVSPALHWFLISCLPVLAFTNLRLLSVESFLFKSSVSAGHNQGLEQRAWVFKNRVLARKY